MAEKTQANPDKLKVLNAVMEKIEKDFGKGSIMRMSSAEVADVQVIPTGSITLDMALGVGGYPKGRVIEITAPNPRARRPWRSTPLPKPRRPAVSPLSSTRNTLSTAPTPSNSAWMSITC